MLVVLLLAALASAPARAGDTASADAATKDATTDADVVTPANGVAQAAQAAAAVDPNTVPTVHDFPGIVQPSDPHFDLEVLYHEHKFNEGLKQAKAELAQHPDDVELHMIVARFMWEMGEEIQRTDPTMNKKEWYSEMLQVTAAGLKLAPHDPHLLFIDAAGKGRLATTRGVLVSLFMAKPVEQEWLESANSGLHYSSLGGEEMLPCDTYEALGIFYRLVPDWWIVKVLAGTRGDLDKSLSWAKKANACYPGRIGAVKELGVTQMCIGNRRAEPDMLAKGKATLEGALKLPASSPSDKIDVRHIKMLLARPAMACDYSRDGQQDLDEKKLARAGN